MTIQITKKMVTDEICGTLCMMAESSQHSSYELTDMFTLIKDWDNGHPLKVSWRVILIGYHAYGTDRIPEFISKDWNRSLKIYKKLKGL
jgi:hypothetical protein